MSGLPDSSIFFCATSSSAAISDNWTGSPCQVCAKAPCCRNVPLCEVDPDTRADFDGLLFLLQFREIELGLKDDGSWIVLYRSTCRFLDTATNQCPIHETAEQPHICQNYSGKTCWYRQVFFSHQNHLFLRFDFDRLQSWLAECRFDEHGILDAAPSWSAAEALLKPLPFRQFDPDLVRNSRLADPLTGATYHSRRMERLCMPPGPPVMLKDWDFVKFRLGFPGLRFRMLESQGWFEAEVHSWEPPCDNQATLAGERQAEIEAAGQRWLTPLRLLNERSTHKVDSAARNDLVLAARHVVPLPPGNAAAYAQARIIHRDDLPALIQACSCDDKGRIISYPR